MKKLHLLKRTLLLLALIVGFVNYGWADDELFYTLTPASGTNNAYASSCDVAISGITWNVVGNSQLGDKIWGIGGKNISNQDRTIYSKTQMSSAISKIEMEASSESGITVNSVKLIVANDAGFTDKIDEVSVTFSSGNTMTIRPSSPKTEWDKNAYYKFVFNVTVSGNKNKKVTFSGAKFYKIKSAAFTITPVSNDDDMGTVALSGTTITATPASGYRVSTSTPYEVTSGTATVVDNGDNTFSVTPTTDCTVQINFEAIPTYAVTIYAPTGGTLVVKNGDDALESGDEVEEGTVLTVEATPSDGYNFINWQYKLGDGSWNTRTANFDTPAVNAAIEIRANFAAKVYHDAIFKINGGSTHATVKTEEGQPIAFPSDPAEVDGREFVGWVTEEISGTTDEEPAFVSSANMGNADVTYYACYAYQEISYSESEIELAQTLQYDTWTYSGSTTNKSGYRLFHTDSYISSAIFDLSLLKKVKVFGGTYGGPDYNKLTIGDGTNTWKSVTVTGNSETGENEYTDGTALSGNKALRITSNSGTATGTGVRISKVEIYTKKKIITGNGYCTTVPADAREAVNILSFTATNTTLVIGNTTDTEVTNDQDGWTESYIYESDNSAVATVSAEGVVTAVAKGTANITVTLDIPKTGGDYKKGTTYSKTIAITVTKPFHTVTFMSNGTELSSESVEEDAEIDVPADPSAISGYTFQGWKSSAIDGTTDDAPSYATITTMGDADVTYYAVFCVMGMQNVTATFDASNISNLESSGTRTWTDTATGISLYLSAGSRYTGGTPNTWTVTGGTSNYMLLYKEGAKMNSVEVTVTGSDFKVEEYKVYVNDSDEDGTDLTSSVAQSGNVYSLDIDGNYEQIGLFASSSQIRATKVVVGATLMTTSNYCTTIPTTTVTIASACTDGVKFYGTYSNSSAFIVPEGLTVSEVGIVDDKLYVEEYTEGDIVPANTGVMISATSAGEKTLTLAAGGSSKLGEDNCLKASGDEGINAAAMEATAPDCNYYRLTMHEGTQIGFWWGAEAGAAFSIAANKAYLAVPVAAGAHDFVWFDEGETTALSEVRGLKSEVRGEYFNLNGQRVAQPTKGLYIVNGRKVVVK